MTIKEVSERYDVTQDTLRYYELPDMLNDNAFHTKREKEELKKDESRNSSALFLKLMLEEKDLDELRKIK